MMGPACFHSTYLLYTITQYNKKNPSLKQVSSFMNHFVFCFYIVNLGSYTVDLNV